MKKPKTKTWKRGIVFKPNDILKINFGEEKYSVYKVVEANKRKNILKIEVLEEYYEGICNIFRVGDVVDIGKVIFEQYWFFILEKAKQNTTMRTGIINEK